MLRVVLLVSLFLLGCNKDIASPNNNSLKNVEKRYRFLPKPEVEETSVVKQDEAFLEEVKDVLVSIDTHKKTLVKEKEKKKKRKSSMKQAKKKVFIPNGESYKTDSSPVLRQAEEESVNTNALKMYF
ncbi:MAG: Unknown protein [uncultured Sulfurovum sp.]|uniref:Lipoprotein n=1 Tax=uncultured Sulfurovum sp. TaxID=269237 RepID=A0A6S6STW8_9BACT|nr:MAG: Unknown protein [uncultured Sulfurovum sp.]